MVNRTIKITFVIKYLKNPIKSLKCKKNIIEKFKFVVDLKRLKMH
jgi:hypothetical protein